MISWLQTQARAKDVAVFPHFGDTPRCEGSLAVDEIQSPAHAKSAVLGDIWRCPQRRSDSGINE
jgi:thiol-disulfide isomerase/thioredoxin